MFTLNTSERAALVALVLEIGLAMWLFAVPVGDHYDTRTGRIVCSNTANCQHEAGHALDAASGWISETEAWRAAVDHYRANPANAGDTLYPQIALFPGIGAPRWPCPDPRQLCHWQGWGGYSELYADLVRMAGGNVDNIPQALRQFYDHAKLATIATPHWQQRSADG